MIPKLGGEGTGSTGPAHWMIVNTLTTCPAGRKATSERGGTNVDARPQPSPQAGLTQVLEPAYCEMLYELTG
jgi:hypothetical protein